MGLPTLGVCLKALPKNLSENDRLDSTHHVLHKICVSGSGVVTIDASISILILRGEFFLYELTENLFFKRLSDLLNLYLHCMVCLRLVILYIIWAGVLFICFRQCNFLQFFFEEVPLVEEDNEWGFSEENIVEHVAKELFSLQHSVCCLILPQHLVVVAQGNDEHDCNAESCRKGWKKKKKI